MEAGKWWVTAVAGQCEVVLFSLVHTTSWILAEFPLAGAKAALTPANGNSASILCGPIGTAHPHTALPHPLYLYIYQFYENNLISTRKI